jgi:hypothetical protein
MSALAMSDYVLGAQNPQTGGERFLLWIDRVGAFVLCMGDRVSVGGPASEGAMADISLLANLSRRHATFVRSGERYVLHAHASALAAGRPVNERADLCDGTEIVLGTSVRLRFRLPTVMSGTARIEFVSDHRPTHAADGVILMDETCLLGPAAENHIRCPGWPQSVLLFRREGKIWCKSREDLFIDGQHAPGGGPLDPGSTVAGHELRFRIEAL